jgi:hypothetical protein
MVHTGNNMSTAALTMQEIDDMLDEAGKPLKLATI